MRPIRTLLLSLLIPAVPAAAYLDDRSTPAQVVESLYDAVDAGQYARAWGYFSDRGAPEFAAFRDGYADTAHVRVRPGPTTSEGAAGTIHWQVPAVVEATDAHGKVTVYAGCYRLSQPQPALQESPPFRPIAIDGGTLRAVAERFEAAEGECG